MFFSPRTFATPVSTWTKNVFFRGLLPPQNEKPALPLSPGQCRFCTLHTQLASKDTIKQPLCLFDHILSRFIMPPCCFAWCQMSDKTTLFLNKKNAATLPYSRKTGHKLRGKFFAKPDLTLSPRQFRALIVPFTPQTITAKAAQDNKIMDLLRKNSKNTG